MKRKLSPDDEALFRQAMKGVKPLGKTKEKIEAKEPRPLPRRLKAKFADDEPSADSFSDHEYLEPVDSETPLFYARPSLSAKLIRDFRRGQAPIEAVLDLHGMTVEEARQTLQRFLDACQQEKLALVIVVHGKGRGNTRPVLKNKLNHWLRQTEQVLAFCSAKQKDGGNGALYVRLKR